MREIGASHRTGRSNSSPIVYHFVVVSRSRNVRAVSGIAIGAPDYRYRLAHVTRAIISIILLPYRINPGQHNAYNLRGYYSASAGIRPERASISIPPRLAPLRPTVAVAF